MAEPSPSPPIQTTAAAARTTQNADQVHEESRKRKAWDISGFGDSSYFKIRRIVRDLRPFFLELLKAPDFRNCEAAHEIQKQLKAMVELIKQLMTDGDSSLKPSEQPLSTETTKADQPDNLQEEKNPASQPQIGQVPLTPEPGCLLNISEQLLEQATGEIKEPLVSGKPQVRIHLVGGSPIGWNFLILPGTLPVYYGATKASVLLGRATKGSKEKA